MKLLTAIQLLFFKNIKKNTNSGGFNVISIPTKTKVAIEFPYLFKDKSELYDYYRDWEIIHIEEKSSTYSNGKEGTTALIIVKKPN